ncbi:MAG: right-handed parallel beta-helix repeat-containing protein, partial [Planctomycetota bacterium]
HVGLYAKCDPGQQYPVTLTDCDATSGVNDAYRIFDSSAFTATGCTATTPIGTESGFEVHSSNAVFVDCVAEDIATSGFFVNDCPSVTMNRCLALNAENGLYARDSTVSVTNCLFVGSSVGLGADASGSVSVDHATVIGGSHGLRSSGGHITARNVVVQAPIGVLHWTGGSTTLDHVLIDAGTPYDGASAGSDDILKSPEFRDAANGDYRLAKGSPAINAGVDLTGTVDSDLLGAARPSHRRHDLGAYEYLEAEGSLRILEWKEAAK